MAMTVAVSSASAASTPGVQGTQPPALSAPGAGERAAGATG